MFLKERGIALPGAEGYPSVESLRERFISTGFVASRALTLKEIRKECISNEELERLVFPGISRSLYSYFASISSLEFLDETEELDLVLAHYAISWGLSISDMPLTFKWGGWGLKKKIAEKEI